ncbi:MAG: hypothetical protein ACRD1N_04930 [Terriglobia bacterium]
MIDVLVRDAVKLLVVLLGLAYGGLVLAGYMAEGARYQPKFHLDEPARSGERLLVWTGIKVLDAVLRVMRSMLNQLFMASAEVGFWFIDKSGPRIQRKVRSRFI